MVLFIIIFLGLSVDRQSHAAEKTNGEIVSQFALYYLASNRLSEAESTLKEYLTEYDHDYENWNLLGITELRKNDPKMATLAFGKACQDMSVPGAEVFKYNLADAQARSGDVVAARKTLQGISGFPSVSDSVADALSELQAGKPLPTVHLDKSGAFSESGEFRFGYDTNVLQTSDANIAQDKASGIKSLFIEPSVQLDYAKDSGSNQWSSKVNTKFIDYSSAKAKIYNNLLTSGSTTWQGRSKRFDKLHNDKGVDVALDYINTNGFRFYYWSVAPFFREIWEQSYFNQTIITLTPGFQKFAVSKGDDPASDRTGFTGKLEIQQKHNFGATSVSIGLGVQDEFSNGNNYKSFSYFLPIGLTTTQLFWDILLGANAQIGQSRYPKSLGLRKDTNLAANLNLFKRITAAMTASLGFQFAKDISNSVSNRYSKEIIGASVSYDF